MNKILLTAVTSCILAASAATFAVESETVPTEVIATAPAEATAPTTTLINPAHPSFIMSMMNPGTHQVTHEIMKNPANWMQFMQPQFYMQMANPANAMAWMSPAVMQSMMNPATMMHWMQPANIMNEMGSIPVATMMNPATFMNFMNPAIAQPWMNPTTYSSAISQMDPTASTQGMFDMNAWTKMFQPTAPQVADTETKEQG
jgi:hypothetical protein